MWLTLQTLFNKVSHKHIHVRADNRTAVAYINKMGGTKSPHLIRLSKDTWDFCLSRSLTLSAEYIPGSVNQVADALSRETPDASDWQLDPDVFHRIDKVWGPLQADLFASRTNHHILKYFSWKAYPGAAGTDSMICPWPTGTLYAFPPFCLVPRCLAKIRKLKAQVVLVAPIWSNQAWYASLLKMAVEAPIRIPTNPRTLRSPVGHPHPLLANNSLHLAAWKVSGDLVGPQEFRKTLRTSWLEPSEQAHKLFTGQPGDSGVAGALNGSLIHFRPLWDPC